MALEGKGFFIWKIHETENGDPNAIAALASQASLTHVLIKIADGEGTYGINPRTGIDLAPALVQALKARHIQAWGWHYVYGYDPLGEADKAVQRVRQLGLDGYVVDAEAEYKAPGKDKAARQFMARLRAGLPSLPVALSSYRYPSYHPQFPFSEFLEKCDYNMPQVYWMQSHNPGDQLRRCVREYQALAPYRPIIPVGAAFTERNWSPTGQEQVEFLRTAQSLNLSAANFYEWSNVRRFLPDSWEAICNYAWSPLLTGDITQQFIEALNSHDPARVLALYAPNGVHVNYSRTIQGQEALRKWYQNLFGQILSSAKFRLTNFSGEGLCRHFTWTASSPSGTVNNGSDMFGLVNGKIAYHYSSFTVI